jgi:SAM-dependent methyltransferase
MTNFNPDEYWEKRLREKFSLLGVGDISRGRHYNEWLYRVRKRIFPRLIKNAPIDLSKATVLDIGSGTGFYIDCWKEQHVAKLIGSDITHVVVETLSQKYPDVEFVHMDIGQENIPLSGKQFDVISAFDVLYHIVDDERFARAIRNIYSLLKPGGFFIFSDNFLHGETARVQDQVSRSLREIESLVTGTGFQIIGRYPMFIIMAYPIDSHTKLGKITYRIIFKLGTINEIVGYVWGAILFPIELLLLSIFKESPTTEMMICKKND